MESLVHRRERVYFWACVAVSALVYALLVVTVVGALYLLLAALIVLLARGLAIGALRGKGVKVTEHQFPDLHRLVERLALQMGLPRTPDVYIVQAGGLLQAFATHFLGRNFVVLSADVLELEFASGEPALGFFVAHELAHVKRRHAAMRPLLLPALVIPFLGSAYARACEYSCDAIGAHCRPDGAADGIRVLAAGKRLYAAVDVEELLRQAEAGSDFWTWLAEMLSGRPFLSKRLAALPEMARSAGATRLREPGAATATPKSSLVAATA